MLSPDLLHALADPPGGLLDWEAGVRIMKVVRDRRSSWRCGYVEAIWQKKGPTYAVTTARFYADGRVEETRSSPVASL
jgi:hypothetical protein